LLFKAAGVGRPSKGSRLRECEGAR
jgi:hypothetical protein